MSAAAETLLALAIYNSWRRGDETIEMPEPAEIGATIDDAVNLLCKYDDLKARAERAEAELKRYTDAVDAQPWASDAPIRVLLDQITSELLTTRNLLMADTEAGTELQKAQAELAKIKTIIASIEEDGTEEHNAAVGLRQELATERARLDWLELRGPWDSWKCFGETGITLRENIRAAIDAAIKEGA